MSAGVDAACRLLPVLARQIEELAKRDESFADLCDDLAVAELALAGLKHRLEPSAKERLPEYEGWIVSLTAEIEDAVHRADGQEPLR